MAQITPIWGLKQTPHLSCFGHIHNVGQRIVFPKELGENLHCNRYGVACDSPDIVYKTYLHTIYRAEHSHEAQFCAAKLGLWFGEADQIHGAQWQIKETGNVLD